LLAARCLGAARRGRADHVPQSASRTHVAADAARAGAPAAGAHRVAAEGFRHLESDHLETYYRRACHFGLGLHALGLEAGGHVGVISENRLEWVLAQMGTGLVGAVTVGVYSTSPTPEVAYVLGHADVDIVVCEDRNRPTRCWLRSTSCRA
jgi:long-subunit acyl-CoA synthetase (AMP-forming)